MEEHGFFEQSQPKLQLVKEENSFALAVFSLYVFEDVLSNRIV